ncbi:type VI secretion system tip protein VgrG, partial [Xenorhabdus sp. Flor]
MSIKKNINKLKQGKETVQKVKQVAGKLGGGRSGAVGLIPGGGYAGGIGGSSGSSMSGTAGLIPGGGFTGGKGLAERSAGGQNSATKALEKVGQMLMGGRDPSGLQFTLTAGGLLPQTFVVTDFTLNESFSQPFSLSVGLASADPAIDFPAVLDRTATLTILQNGIEQRSITGIVARFEQGNTGLHQTTYQMIIRPDLWRTTL